MAHTNPDAEITQLQKALLTQGYDIGPSGADGIAGRFTDRAVAAFLAGKGVPATGHAHEDRQRALQALHEQSAPASKPGREAAAPQPSAGPIAPVGTSTDKLNELAYHMEQGDAPVPAATAPRTPEPRPTAAHDQSSEPARVRALAQQWRQSQAATGGGAGLRSPLGGEHPLYITSPFGPRANPLSGKQEFHQGIDIRAPFGAPVYATSDGTVIDAGRSTGSGGNFVAIRDNEGRTHRYYHLGDIRVKPGDHVSPDSGPIAAVGPTGLETGPHLYYQVDTRGQPVNPLHAISPSVRVSGNIPPDASMVAVDAPGRAPFVPGGTAAQRGPARS